MKKTLTMAVATLIVGAVTASAAITTSVILETGDDLIFDGTWNPLNDGDTGTAGGTFWTADVTGKVIDLGGGVNMYTIAVKGKHNVGGAPQWATLGVGLFDIAGSQGWATTSVPHGKGDDVWALTAKINPAGTMKFNVSANHPIPEPGSFALIAGLGLVGFAAYRRTRA